MPGTNALCAEKVSDGTAIADDWDCIDPFSPIAKHAISICNDCPVQAECWSNARRLNAWGVWGGAVWRNGAYIRRR